MKQTSSLRVPTSKCKHAPSICDDCLRKHIAEEVNGKGITRSINCPECKQQLEHNEIHRISQGSPYGRVTFERYDSLLFRRTMESMPSFIWSQIQRII